MVKVTHKNDFTVFKNYETNSQPGSQNIVKTVLKRVTDPNKWVV